MKSNAESEKVTVSQSLKLYAEALDQVGVIGAAPIYLDRTGWTLLCREMDVDITVPRIWIETEVRLEVTRCV